MILSLGGGILIGCAANLIEWAFGDPAGISGITSSVLGQRRQSWHSFFILGLVATGVVLALFFPDLVVATADRSLIAMAAAGLLVGVGVRLGSGCTSGHGVCGISRRRPRSFVATTTFIAVGMCTVTLIRTLHSGGGV
jgi:uncharacterized membrane protein YedE/YeeE